MTRILRYWRYPALIVVGPVLFVECQLAQSILENRTPMTFKQAVHQWLHPEENDVH